MSVSTVPAMISMILISACLAGICCKYNGGSNETELIRRLYEEGKAVTVCPEVLGGLPVPRTPGEIREGKVISADGEDITEYYRKGAQKALQICLEKKCALAVLKSRSPSCGCHQVYDGTFSHVLVEGKGVFAQLLEDNGIICMDEEEYIKGV